MCFVTRKDAPCARERSVVFASPCVSCYDVHESGRLRHTPSGMGGGGGVG